MSAADMEGVIQDIERFLEMVKVGLKMRGTSPIIYCIPPVVMDVIIKSTEALVLIRPENSIDACKIISKALDEVNKCLIERCDEMEAEMADKSKNPDYN